MPTLVSTGQFTIIDNNDARTVTALLSASTGTQQVFSKDNTTVSYNPNWFSTNLTITPVLSVSGLTQALVWGALTNKQFSFTQNGTPITSATTSTNFVDGSNTVISTATVFTVTHGANGTSTVSTLVLKANLLSTVPTATIYFDADYTDNATGLTTHITCQVTLNSVQTGTNAVYITTRGTNYIQESSTAVKNVVALSADLIRSSGLDVTSLTYKWFDTVSGLQISTSTPNYATLYGMKTVASPTPPTAVVGDLGVNVPASGAGNAFNTLVISENAVSTAGMGIYRVEITDAIAAATYVQYFTITDVSDPYQVVIASTGGDKLQNGIGSTSMSPIVYSGSTPVASLTGWSFAWTYYDKNGNRGAFVDTAKISVAGGAPITANTIGASATITYTGTSYAFVAGDIIKAVNSAGNASFYEVASSTSNIVTIRVPATTNNFLSATSFPAPVATTDFVGGKLFGCVAGGVRTTSGNAAIVVTGDDIDVKGNVFCAATRP
jgi:hypothetical protein